MCPSKKNVEIQSSIRVNCNHVCNYHICDSQQYNISRTMHLVHNNKITNIQFSHLSPLPIIFHMTKNDFKSFTKCILLLWLFTNWLQKQEHTVFCVKKRTQHFKFSHKMQLGGGYFDHPYETKEGAPKDSILVKDISTPFGWNREKNTNNFPKKLRNWYSRWKSITLQKIIKNTNST